jgi:hypothetical protein
LGAGVETLMKKRVALGVAAGVALGIGLVASAYQVFIHHFALPSFPPYRGDGLFLDRTRIYPPIHWVVPGYGISLPEFDLDCPKEAEYRLVGLPDVGRCCIVYFAVRGPGRLPLEMELRETLEPLEAAARVEVMDSSRNRLAIQDGKLSTYIISWHGDLDFQMLYQAKVGTKSFEEFVSKCAFRPVASETYIVRLSYLPSAKLRGYRGFIYAESLLGK